MSDNTDWTEATIARLRALWDEGHSTAEIGRRMGVTKNAVIGKSHRLELPARPSPIRRGAVGRDPPTTPRQPRPAHPVLAVPRPVSDRPAAIPVPAQPPPTPPPRRRYGLPGQPCCWPIGEPGRPGFRFCEREAEPSRPYCPEHSSIAYAKPETPKEGAARQPQDATRRA